MAEHFKSVARRLIKQCCLQHPQGSRAVSELIESFGTAEDETRFLDTDSPRQAANRLAALTNALRNELASYEERRLRPPLIESAHATGEFLYAYSDDPKSEMSVRRLRARYRVQVTMHELIQKLDDVLFEALCGKVIRSMGCVGVTVTRSSKDEGIDFTGRLPLSAAAAVTNPDFLSAFFRVAGGINFFLVGQAKRYGPDNPVGREAVSQLHGDALKLVNDYADRLSTTDAESSLRRADYKRAQPRLLVMATTSEFSREATATAESLGIVTLDGQQLAQLLVQAKIGIEELSDLEWATDAVRLAAACA